VTTASTASSTPTPALDANWAGFRGLELVRGEGPYVFDTEGRRFLDATSMYGVAALGHAHPALARAVAHQSGRLTSCFASFANDARNELLGRLHTLLDPLDRFFLCNSGTEAVEAALKFARRSTGRAGVVALAGAFHGRTLGSLSATFRSKHRDAFQPLLPGFAHVRAGDTAALERALDADGTGLFLAEIIQGEGGVRPVSGAFLHRAQELCRERGILFAVDEVQTGIGRTGRWFGFRHHGLEPDLVCLAKGLGGGLPIGALAFRAAADAVDLGSHGSTFGGNPLCCAAANSVLETIETEGLVEQTAQAGARLLAHLRQLLANELGTRVRDVRGQGLMIGVELAASGVPVQKRLQDRGFLVLGAGPRVLRLLPPLTTPWEALEELGTALAEEVTR